MKPQLLIPILSLLVLSACETDGLYDTPVTMTEKVQIAPGIVVHNETENRLELLAVTQTDIRNRRLLSLEKGEVIHRVFQGKDGVLSTSVYTVTYPGNARQTDLAPTLHVVDGNTQEVTSYTTGSLFGNHHFDPSGKYLILYHDESDQLYTGGLSNTNEIAIVDVTRAPSAANPIVTTIDIAGHTIERITFLDEITIGNVPRKLVAFSTSGAIQFIDFNSSDFPSITVALKTDDDPRVIVPNKFQMIPATGTRGPRLFVKADGATEIYDIEFNPKDTPVGFYATTALLDSGTAPGDFALVPDGDDLFLVTAASNSRQLVIFNTGTAYSKSLILDDTVNMIMEHEQNGERELVMFGPYTQNIYFLAFSDMGIEMGDNLQSVNVPGGISDARILDNDRLMLFSSSNENVIIFDLRTRSMVTLSGAGYYDWGNGKLWSNTYFLAEYSLVSYLNIASGSPGTLALDEQISELYVFEQQGMGVAMHFSPTGRATLFPLRTPTRAACSIVDGFYIFDILERGEE